MARSRPHKLMIEGVCLHRHSSSQERKESRGGEKRRPLAVAFVMKAGNYRVGFRRESTTTRLYVLRESPLRSVVGQSKHSFVKDGPESLTPLICFQVNNLLSFDALHLRLPPPHGWLGHSGTIFGQDLQVWIRLTCCESVFLVLVQ